jgi:hypothetical protein
VAAKKWLLKGLVKKSRLIVPSREKAFSHALPQQECQVSRTGETDR